MIHQTVAIPEQDYALFLEVIKRFKCLRPALLAQEYLAYPLDV